MRCLKCNHENGATDRFCGQCGALLPRGRLPGAAENKEDDVIADLQRVQQDLDSELKGVTESVDAEVAGLLRPHQKPSLEPKAAAGSSRILQRFGGTAAAPSAFRAAPEKYPGVPAEYSRVSRYSEVSADALRVEMPYLNWLNYALFHTGVPVVQRLELANGGQRDLGNLMIEISPKPPVYGDPWRTTVSGLDAGATWREEGEVRLPLKLDRLRAVVELERAALELTVREGDRILWARTKPLDIHAYNEWIFIPEAPYLLAAFVQPNQAVIQTAIAKAAALLKERTGDDAFAGYQTGGPERRRDMVAALHDTLIESYALRYINPPASFEKTGQKIRDPEDVLKNGQGTCLDLSALMASLMEQVGLHPVICLVPGHAFLAVWNEDYVFKHSPAPEALSDKEVAALVEQGCFCFFNSTTLTHGKPFEDAAREGDDLVARLFQAAQQRAAGDSDAPLYLFLIDICACRMAGVRPLP